MFRHIYLLVPAQAIVAEFLATFKEFPPRQKAASFSLDQVIEKMTEASSGAGLSVRGTDVAAGERPCRNGSCWRPATALAGPMAGLAPFLLS